MNASGPHPLIVNADDAGLDPATDDAILACARHGILRNASVISNGPTAADFVPRANAAGLDLGLHLNLTEGLALAGPIAGVTDPEGHFLGTANKAHVVARLWGREPAVVAGVAREVAAQWHALEALGAAPTHLDGHNHVHAAPSVRAAVRALPGRLFVRHPVEPDGRQPDWYPESIEASPPSLRVGFFVGLTLMDGANAAQVARALAPCHGATEWMVHPGCRPGSRFTENAARRIESSLLCDPAFRNELLAAGFKPATFAELRAGTPA